MIKKQLFLIFVRHGEREDEVPQKGQKIEFDYDPGLTFNGKKQANQAGTKILKFLKDRKLSEIPLKIISSPFLRTLQTASHLQNEITKNIDVNLIVNTNISVKLSKKFSKDPIKFGALATKKNEILIQNYLDGLVKEISFDQKSKLQRPQFPEASSTSRYLKGFNDIIQNYFIENQDEQQQVIILVSHSDGVNPFLQIGGKKIQIKNPEYCCTIFYEIHQKEQSFEIIDQIII